MTAPLSWVRARPERAEPRRCLFLDRDGVINEHIKNGYVLQWSEFVWRPGVVASLSEVVATGVSIVVVSNQSCVGRGITSGTVVTSIMDQMVRELNAAQIPLEAWYCCPHAPEDGCSCRKPAPGMLLTAAAELNIDLPRSYLIGDAATDVEAGAAAGCATWRVNSTPDFEAAIAEIIRREHSLIPTREVTSC